jgi:hydroxypyruvate isomerase
LRQAFAWWSFSYGRDASEAESLLRIAADIGFDGVEMLPEPLWGAAADAGLAVVTLTGHDLDVGFNDPANHSTVSRAVSSMIDDAASAHIPNVIVFSGKRGAADDAAAIEHCVAGLTPLAGYAGTRRVTLLLETLNSKIDHPGAQCDHSVWGLEVVRRVGSPALRLLYDCYHMQVMEGDLLRTLKANLDSIGHIHTGGVPGRRDLDDRQEVNWRAIAALLRRQNFAGWVGHEFIPRDDPRAALQQAYAIFNRIDSEANH